jgi:multidrug resistance efflux pump
VVAANAPLLTLVDLARLEVELEIPETYVADLGLGMNVEISAGDIRATGKLSAHLARGHEEHRAGARALQTAPSPPACARASASTRAC